MNFGQALDHLKNGHKLARYGWNGKQMFIYLVKQSVIDIESLKNEASIHLEASKESNQGKTVIINSHIDMKSADGSIVVGWLASQTDMLATDWVLV